MTGIQMAVNSTRTAYALANLLGVSHQRVNYWLKTGKPSPTYCAAISRITGVSKRRLRPDVFS